MNSLSRDITLHFERPKEELGDDTRLLVRRLLEALNAGEMRAAHRDEQGRWTADLAVKRGILLGFRVGEVRRLEELPFLLSDKDTFPLRQFDPVPRNVRIVPGGSSIRDGCYLGQNVTCMPPMYINVGAWVDEDTMIDSHVLIGSCAQIGKRVHLSAGAQIGGVLEPVGEVPVVIEDDVLIGGHAGIFEGTIVRRAAVIAAGTILTRSTRVYDLVRAEVYAASDDCSLEIPPGAVVVPGSRPAKGAFAEAHGLQVYAPVIIKYRDDSTDSRTSLEEHLR